MKNLVGKNIVITGASSGIGEKIAFKVAEMGARPILLARSSDKLNDVCEKINQQFDVSCIFYPLDVGDFEEVKVVFRQLLQEVDHVDILLNNAGFGVFDSFQEANFEDIQRMFEVNVLGLMACTKEILSSMLERDTGHIINIASQAGKLATPKSSGYSASKHAVLGFTNSLRMELEETNIFVSSVNPGPIETNFFNNADKSGNYVKNIKKFMLKSDEVAEKIVDLMLKPKRELNLPKWMNLGSTLYNLFPGIAERITGGILNKK
ncbi:SDR family NAD(P)-dependent oxidoreductase [Neobacillus terrae]|uniref:SDR family NAD(P)-dependent oxidoreductase n=1 Tax=Neobacillus terrae TaxID=3034837 RepID=UPI00140BA877|nr:SDR family oxidoreductase [Neobacillus terrae]NHM29012.1 SDR family oxidoreductase [Neobacillus terrae]